MRGCRTRQVLSAGHGLFVRKFSASPASANLDWRDVFEDFFGKSLPSRSSENQLVGSATFLFDILEKVVQTKAVRKKPLKKGLSKEELQLFDDVGLPQVFKHLIEDLSVDHAVVLCTKLPANYLNTGINTLIRLLLERVQQNDVEIKDQDVLAEKILELIKLSKGRSCTLSEETSQRLLTWLLNSGDAPRRKDTLQLLGQKNMDLPQAKHVENTTENHLGISNFVDPSCDLGNKCRITKGLSNFLKSVDFTDPSSKTRLLTTYYSLGKSAFTGKGKESFIQLQELHLKGMPEDDLGKLIDSFTKGLTEVHPNSRDIRRDVDVFKKITRLLKSTNTIASFNMLISHCANHGEIDLCVDLIQTMKVRGLELGASSYEPLIKFFARTLEISKAEDILKVMRLSGMRVSAKAYASLIVAHAKACNFVRAFNLIEDIPWKDLTADIYTPIIHAYGAKGQVSLALSVFLQMKWKRVKPIGENYASLIHACANGKNRQGAEKVFKLYKKQGEFSEECHKKVMAAMLRVYAGSGDFKKLEKMMSCTDVNVLVKPEVKSALLKGFAEAGRNDEALQIYNEIRSGGGWPDAKDFLSLLWSLSHSGKLDQLLALFEPFRKLVQPRNRVVQEELMSIACSSIVHGLILHNHLEGALTFLQKVQLEDAGDVETLCLKVFMEDKGNLAIPQRAHLPLKEKLQFMRAMREKLRIQPTRLAYESLLESCAKEKDAHHAEAVLHMMRSDKLQLNVFTYMIMLRVVIGRGDSERATFLISEMKETMQNNGLMDNHVKLIIQKILKSGNAGVLMQTLYQQ